MNDKKPATLTEFERQCLDVFRDGVEEENEGYLQEMEWKCPVQGPALLGVVASLEKKGAITARRCLHACHTFLEEDAAYVNKDKGAVWIDVADAFCSNRKNERY